MNAWCMAPPLLDYDCLFSFQQANVKGSWYGTNTVLGNERYWLPIFHHRFANEKGCAVCIFKNPMWVPIVHAKKCF